LSKLIIDKNYILDYQLIEGDPDKPYLVFLHEGLGCSAIWEGFATLLCRATGCPGLLYDRLGYGKSSALKQMRTVHYLHEYALQELPLVLQAVIPDMPFVLIGHSDGGSISLIYGADRPALLQGIITEAAHVFVDAETISGIRSTVEAWRKGKLTGLSKYHGDKTETLFNAWSATWLSSWFNYWNIEYLLPGIVTPLLVIQGNDDQYGSIEQAESIVSQASNYARMEMVENCGHAPHKEARPVILELMADFILEIRVTP